MINILFQFENEHISSVEVTGHADSGPYGQDIVCAAVSALSIGTVNSLIEIGDISLDIVSADEQGGFLKFSLPEGLSQKQIEIAQILMNSLHLSLKNTEAEYGDYMTVHSSNNK
ncbi:ribosomal-processing cysteine protease Prp [Alkalibacterium pelagium]|jgi:uncharacterized protein YsxB (DUF464 family)|uniref:Ribosomal processing cysteine protease Prp n=1 Tax=Alkalibacterium pelagium TaxID=426702 RepID=A0A1H7GTJ0_9LACT|nr:ribosomal-processing cysteine protease Prp [Alkalibacterium pelagium]GEN49727.1 hypothetical protein APE02nite_03920 [Alkalibacterium pelagium]SEK40352.1 hypothetical protein SAMN04488099_102245 [Alkalibacterium pelagium]